MAISHCNLVSPVQLDLEGSASLAAWNNSFRQSQEFGTFTTIADYPEQFQVVPPWGKTCSVFCFKIWLQTVGLTISSIFVSSWTPALNSLFTFLLYRLEVLLNLFTCAKWLLLLVLISKENQHPAGRQLYWWGPIDFSLLSTYHQ